LLWILYTEVTAHAVTWKWLSYSCLPFLSLHYTRKKLIICTSPVMKEAQM
jgi:hypothetical protein